MTTQISLECTPLHCEEYDDAFLSDENKIVEKLEELSKQHERSGYDVVFPKVVGSKLVIYGCYEVKN